MSKNTKRKANDFKGALIKLVKNCKPYRVPIIIAFALSMISSILAIIGPNQLKEITNLITQGIQKSVGIAMATANPNAAVHLDMEAIAGFGCLLIVLYVASFVLGYINSFIMVTVVNRFAQQLRKRISEKINRLPLRYFDNSTIGDVLSRITNDVDTISESLNENISTLVGAITMFIGSAVMMFVTNWILAIAAILSSFIGFVFMFIILKRSQKYFAAYQKQLGTMNGHVEEAFSGHNVIKAYNAEGEVNQRFDEINTDLRNSSRYSQFYAGMMIPIMGFISNFGYVVVCIVGSILVLSGNIEFGVVVAFMLYTRLFTQPLTQFGSTVTGLQSTAAAAERVFDFLEAPEMEPEDEHPQKLTASEVNGDVNFDHVRFGYNADKIIIKDFNAAIKAKQKVAIVGPTGAGKTTLVNLLMRFYEINSGSISIDGVPTKNITRANLRELFTMVLQDTWLFEGTIIDNIRYNKTDVSEKRIKEVCKQIGVDHFIRSLPKGYNTVLKNSESLSAGQKQLLTIARAMVDDAPLLILDEATSSVDTRTEELIQIAMDKLAKGRTSFVIAHRLSTIKNADVIFVMNNGDIIEHGTHNDLMAKNGFYADLYNSQFAEA